MPAWKVHLEVAKRLKNFFKYNDEEYKLFLLGSILPDINNAHFIKASKVIGHDITHFENPNKDIHNSYINFLDEVKYLHNPLENGYFIHLYTDHLWNENFYTKKYRGGDHDVARIDKQNDFNLYANKYIDNNIMSLDINKYLKDINFTEKISLNLKDIEDSINYNNHTKKVDSSYKYYTEEELDELLETTLKKIKMLYSLENLDK